MFALECVPEASAVVVLPRTSSRSTYVYVPEEMKRIRESDLRSANLHTVLFKYHRLLVPHWRNGPRTRWLIQVMTLTLRNRWIYFQSQNVTTNHLLSPPSFHSLENLLPLRTRRLVSANL